MHGGSHPLPRHIEELIAQLKVFALIGKAHAFARVLDALAIGGHDSTPLCLVQAGDKRDLSHRRLDKSRCR
jgi:hypothetical protein